MIGGTLQPSSGSLAAGANLYALTAKIDDKLGAPASASEAFGLLQRAGKIDAKLQQRLTGAAGLRNIIVHQYVEIDITKILDVIRHDLGDLERFAHELGS